MKVNPRLKWVAIVAFSAVGGLFVYSGGSSSDGNVAQSDQFKKRNSDFDRFSALRGEANKSQLAPIADESAQRLLGTAQPAPSLPLTLPDPALAEPKPSAIAEAPKAEVLAQAKVETFPCTSSWDSEEGCIDEAKAPPKPKVDHPKATPAPQVLEAPEPAKSIPKTGRRPSGLKLASSEPVERPVAPPLPPAATGGRLNLLAYEQQLIAMSAPNSNVVTGRMTKSNMDILKKGSKYLGIIHEALAIRTGEKHPVTIDIIGRLSNNTTVKPFILYGEAALNKSGTKVTITVTDCIAEAANAGSIPCGGVIQNYKGEVGLEGELYSPDRYALAVKTAGLIFGGVLQGMKTTSRTLTGGVLYDQTFGNGVLDAMSNASVQAGAEEAANAKAKGDEIKIAPDAFVRVLIGEDVALW